MYHGFSLSKSRRPSAFLVVLFVVFIGLFGDCEVSFSAMASTFGAIFRAVLHVLDSLFVSNMECLKKLSDLIVLSILGQRRITENSEI